MPNFFSNSTTIPKAGQLPFEVLESEIFNDAGEVVRGLVVSDALVQVSTDLNGVVLVRSCAVTVGGPPTIEAGFRGEVNQFSEKQLAP